MTLRPWQRMSQFLRRWLPSKRSLLTKLTWGILGLILALILVSGLRGLEALSYRDDPTDGVLVLGGSIRREIYSAQYARSHPQIPILISTGSLPPCIYLIFERDNAPMDRVWLENCAYSTFYNFFYSLPILERWQVHHVELITSASHLPRAIWMARISLGLHGIWVDANIVPEIGRPGNQESRLKTLLDVTRTGLWAVLSQIYSPPCDQLTRLSEVDLDHWTTTGFHCEHQGQVDWQP